MLRLILFTVGVSVLLAPSVPNAESLEKIDELERRFNEYDRRLTAVEEKIQILLDYLRKGQGAVLNEPPGLEGALGINDPGLRGEPFPTRARLRVMEDGTNVYERPSTSSKTIARVNAGIWLDVRGRTEQSGWYHVILPGGQAGYVEDRYIESMR